ncbi:hypothetical protein KQX54_001716 [Cotesia glomerata]|uniref:Uncharacterized protein n=1 Tax=Cotesia glomerata TaxID=32391 RepID=A0AAV7INV3_COTGL|nr:hypothetical protein KQX54_001716 [Cotesia glomerata]
MNLKFDLSHDILRYCWTIPLLPADRFKEATQEILNTIHDTADFYNDDKSCLIKFILNVEEWLLQKPGEFSFYDIPCEAINIAENFTRHMGSNLEGYQPNLFRYLGAFHLNSTAILDIQWKEILSIHI